MVTVRPVMLAVGGDSGTGKTTLTRGLHDLFGADNILNICLDDYHTLDRLGRARAGLTALNPIVNNIALMEQ
ncbi:MAG TPA: zeta toxin family protein, partial [Chloroflexota bacterium]